jgi:peroxiredoxin
MQKSSRSYVVQLLVVSLVLNGVLIYRRVSWASEARVSQPSSKIIKEGRVAPAIYARNLLGEATSVDFHAGLPTLIYVFRPDCHYCEKNFDSVKALAASLHDRYQLVALSLTEDAPTDYLKSHPMPFDVYYQASKESINAYGIHATPTTILVSQDGHVARSWLGAYAGATARTISDTFHVSLPRLDQGGVTE